MQNAQYTNVVTLINSVLKSHVKFKFDKMSSAHHMTVPMGPVSTVTFSGMNAGKYVTVVSELNMFEYTLSIRINNVQEESIQEEIFYDRFDNDGDATHPDNTPYVEFHNYLTNVVNKEIEASLQQTE